MKTTIFRTLICLLAVLLTVSPAVPVAMNVAAAEDTVYLGDRQDLFVVRESLDGFGWNAAHSGERIKIGSQSYDKGLGFHCLPDKDAYVEFDISSLNMKYFAASVGVLKEASYFLEWGSISFHVYGDGELLASSPVKAWNEEPYFLTCSVEGVSTLKLVQNNEGNYACDAGVWGNARLTNVKPQEGGKEDGENAFDPNKTTKPQPSELVSGDYAYISDLYWMDTKTYIGNVVGRDCNTANEIIYSNDGKFFKKGIGFHASSSDYTSYVDVNIEGLGFTKFAAYYGVCETLTSYDITMAAVKFAVFGDGQKLWESGVMRFGEDMEAMECDITGVKTLRIAVAGGPGISGAWGTYGGAVVSKSGEITSAMLFMNPEDITAPPVEDVTEPETETPVEETTKSDIETPTVSETETSTDTPSTETDKSDAGCSSALGCGAVAATAAIALVLKKREED